MNPYLFLSKIAFGFKRTLPPLLLAALPLLIPALLIPGNVAAASTASHYVQLRHQKAFVPNLTYASVQEGATRYIGTVIELSGTVGGVVESADSLSLLLNMEDGSAPTLNIPKSEMDVLRDSSTPRIRVLARVAEGSSGNVVPLIVLCAALDSDINLMERKAAAQSQAEARRAELARKAKEQQVSHSGLRGYSPSRSAASRSVPPPDYSGGLGPRVRGWYDTYYRFILNHNPRLGTTMAGQIAFYLLKFSDQHNVDPRLVTAMIIAESDFDPRSTSHAGAMGLGQLMPDEIRGLGLNNAYDVRQNLYGSIVNLRTDLDTFAHMGGSDGSLSIDQIKLAMATYNAGLGAVKKYNGVPPYRETQGYVKRVTRLYREFCGLPPE